MINDIVTVAWLKDNLNKQDVVVLDASTLATTNRVSSECKGKVIPSARYFDLKTKFADQESELPNTFPTVAQFTKEARELGINTDSHIVVYDNLGIYTSPRVWWMFKTLGHKNVSVLNGGLPEWIKNGNTTEQFHNNEFDLGDFKSVHQPSTIKSYNDVLKNSSSKESVLIDARSKGRFMGTEEEPRKTLKSGHIPNSINVPYTEVLKNGLYKEKEALAEVFKDVENKDVIFSCGSGITACIVLLAAEQVINTNKYVYDGSWTEWAEKQGLVNG